MHNTNPIKRISAGIAALLLTVMSVVPAYAYNPTYTMDSRAMDADGNYNVILFQNGEGGGGEDDGDAVKVILDDNGGHGGSREYFDKENTAYSTSACVTSIDSVNVPSRATYTFLGYFTDADGGDEILTKTV